MNLAKTQKMRINPRLLKKENIESVECVEFEKPRTEKQNYDDIEINIEEWLKLAKGDTSFL